MKLYTRDPAGQESCRFRSNVCKESAVYFGIYSSWDGTEPCDKGSTYVSMARSLAASSCDDQARNLIGSFLNPAAVDTSRLGQAIDVFIYGELFGALQKIGCGLHADYHDLEEQFQRTSSSKRGVMDGVTMVRLLAKAAKAVIEHFTAGSSVLHHAPDRLADLAMLVLRRMYFDEPGGELIGMRFKLEKHPHALSRMGAQTCVAGQSEGWEITDTVKFADDTFADYRPGVLYYVFECVPSMGVCTEVRDGKTVPAPKVLVDLQSPLERDISDALHQVSHSVNVALDRSDAAFETFVTKAGQ
jgi:hypothetical protein